MTLRWLGMVLALAMLLAGCATAPALQSTGPATMATAPAASRTPPLVSTTTAMPALPAPPDGAAPALTTDTEVEYQHGEARLRMHLLAAPTMDPYGKVGQGYVLQVTPSGDPDRRLQPYAWPVRFGLDACMTPLWVWQVRPQAVPQVDFLSGGVSMDTLPGFLVRPDTDVPQMADLADLDRAHPEDSGAVFLSAMPKGHLRFGMGQKDGLVAAAWYADNGTLQRRADGGVWPLGPPATVPRQWQPAPLREAFDLVGLRQSGNPVQPCKAFTPPAPEPAELAVTARATKEDPPERLSLQSAVQRAEADPSLTTLRTFLVAHADAYVTSWTYLAGASALGNATWVLTYGAPGQVEDVEVACTGGNVPMRPELVVYCTDRTGRQSFDIAAPPLPSYSIVAYEAWLQDYVTMTGAPPCQWGVLLVPWPFQDPAPRASLQCGSQGLALWVDLEDGAMETVRDPLPALFTTPFA